MSVNDHKYIKLLEYAVNKKDSSYHMAPGLEAANMTDREFLMVIDTFFVNGHTQASPPGKNEEFDWRLRPEAVFGYLNYKQYEHAQKSSKLALYFSSASLVVAVLTLATNILICLL